MRFALTAVIFLLGLFFLWTGIGFIISPLASGPAFGLTPQGNLGLATIRADMTSFFCVSGIAMMWGAWRRNGDILLAGALLMGFALLGRLVSAVLDGTYTMFWPPMVVEALSAALCIYGSRVLPHHIGVDD